MQDLGFSSNSMVVFKGLSTHTKNPQNLRTPPPCTQRTIEMTPFEPLTHCVSMDYMGGIPEYFYLKLLSKKGKKNL